MRLSQLYNSLVERIDERRVKKNVSIKDHISFKVGGKVDIMILPKNIEEIIHAIKACNTLDVEYLVMGNGSNLIVKDGGFRGVIIKLEDYFNDVTIDGNNAVAKPGVFLSVLTNKLAEANLSGLEFAGGIPGTLGGAVAMNAGAYDGEMSQVVDKVVVLDDKCDLLELSKEELDFKYRHSIIQTKKYIVLEVYMSFNKEDRQKIVSKMKEFNKRRNEKQPLNYPSAGSIFKRPEGYYAGKLIEDAGLKGLRCGGAKISEVHAGFIINDQNATAADVLNLISIIQKIVYDKYGIKLEKEVKVVGEN